MSSPTQIANLALSWMGQNLINDLGDNQNEAVVMNANYALSRDKTLEDAAWTFATIRKILAPLAEAPEFGGGRQFAIPTNVLRVHRVFRPDLTSQSTLTSVNKFQNADWVRNGNVIIANEAAIWTILIVQVTNTALFSPGFIHALAARMAADTAMTLTESSKLEEKMEARYDTKLADAKYTDGSQGRTEIIKSSRLTGTRKR